MKKFVKIFLSILVSALVIIQFIKPDTNSPAEDKTKFIASNMQIPDNIFKQLEKSCFDCHSYRTQWPWYSKISPVVYLINRDVKKGREHLNFSVWGDYDKPRMMDKLDGIETEVRDGEMPLSIYLPMHPEAKLTESDKKMLTDWARTAKEQLSTK
jgi:hypothetical protein